MCLQNLPTSDDQDSVEVYVRNQRLAPFCYFIQKRGVYGGNNENFNRTWDEYKHGFGDHDKEFWLGNNQIHELTKSGDKKLRVELEAWDGRTAWAEYDTFRWEL